MASSLPAPRRAGAFELATDVSHCECDLHPPAPVWVGGNDAANDPREIGRHGWYPPAPAWAGYQLAHGFSSQGDPQHLIPSAPGWVGGNASSDAVGPLQDPSVPSWPGSPLAPGHSGVGFLRSRTPSAPDRAVDRLHSQAGPCHTASRTRGAPSAPNRAGAGLSPFTDSIPPPPRAYCRPPAPRRAEGVRVTPPTSQGLTPPRVKSGGACQSPSARLGGRLELWTRAGGSFRPGSAGQSSQTLLHLHSRCPWPRGLFRVGDGTSALGSLRRPGRPEHTRPRGSSRCWPHQSSVLQRRAG